MIFFAMIEGFAKTSGQSDLSTLDCKKARDLIVYISNTILFTIGIESKILVKYFYDKENHNN